MKLEWAVLIFLSICMLTTTTTFLISSQGDYIDNFVHPDAEHQDTTHSPHYVKIHIFPETEGVKVTAIPDGQGGVLSGLTDSNSDVVFEMIPILKYNLIVGFNFPPCQYYIIPRDAEYIVSCNREGVRT